MLRIVRIFVLCLLLWTSAAVAVSEGITDITVTHNNNELLVSALYKDGFTPEIKDELTNGIRREFFYYIVLHRVISGWFDEERLSETIKYTVKYDILKKQFLVIKSFEDSKEEKVFDSYDEMVKWVSRIDRIKLSPLNVMGKNHTYYVSIKAEIKAGELPFLLRYLLFFIPYSKFSTEWARSNKFMLADFK